MSRRRPQRPLLDGYSGADTRAFLSMGDRPAPQDYTCGACGLRWSGPSLSQCPVPACLSREVHRARGTVVPAVPTDCHQTAQVPVSRVSGPEGSLSSGSVR